MYVNKKFTNDDVKYVKNLLNDRYRDCDVKVYHRICYWRFALKEIKSVPIADLTKEFLWCLKNKPNGVYSNYSKTVYVFPRVVYNNAMDEIKDSYKILCASTLIHELRHYFQHKYMKVDKWSDFQFEKDAMKFEMKMFFRKYDELEKLIR